MIKGCRTFLSNKVEQQKVLAKSMAADAGQKHLEASIVEIDLDDDE